MSEPSFPVFPSRIPKLLLQHEVTYYPPPTSCPCFCLLSCRFAKSELECKIFTSQMSRDVSLLPASGRPQGWTVSSSGWNCFSWILNQFPEHFMGKHFIFIYPTHIPILWLFQLFTTFPLCSTQIHIQAKEEVYMSEQCCLCAQWWGGWSIKDKSSRSWIYFLFTRKETISHSYLQFDPFSGNRQCDVLLDIAKTEAVPGMGLRAGVDSLWKPFLALIITAGLTVSFPETHPFSKHLSNS